MRSFKIKDMKKEKPILFSTPMVQAIMEDRKNQTRRMIKPQPDLRGLRTSNVLFEDWHGNEIKCPYGQVGDVLWVRETWRNLSKTPEYYYKANTKYAGDYECKWKPSIFMPKEAARIWLVITDIKVERLQDVSEEDAKLEGAELYNNYDGTHGGWGAPASYKEAYYLLWESIYGYGSWNLNPWVWVINFEKTFK